LKVIPSNQTLILANERGVGGLPAPAVVRASNPYDPGQLTRVTLVTSQPGSALVYLQAEYASPPVAPRLPALVGPTTRAVVASNNDAADMPAGSGLPLPARSPGQSYTSSRGIALYSSMQRGMRDTPRGHIDVHA
jgi:hypothetical protein